MKSSPTLFWSWCIVCTCSGVCNAAFSGCRLRVWFVPGLPLTGLAVAAADDQQARARAYQIKTGVGKAGDHLARLREAVLWANKFHRCPHVGLCVSTHWLGSVVLAMHEP